MGASRCDTGWDVLWISGDVRGGGNGRWVYEAERVGEGKGGEGVGHVDQCCKRIDL